MRVLLDARMAASGPMHGIARYVVRLLEHMPDEVQFSLLVRGKDLVEATRRFPRHRLITVRSGPFQPWEQVELPWRIAQERPDLVHFTSIAVTWSVGVPTLVTVHDLIPFLGYFPGGTGIGNRLKGACLHLFLNGVKSAYFHLLLGPLVRRADAVVVGSEHTARDVRARLGVKDPKVIYYGVDFPAFPAEETAAAEPAQPATEPFLLCVSNPKPHKNLLFLLNAFRKFAHPLKLVLISPGSPELDEAVQKDPRITRKHPVTENELQTLLRTAWAVVMPSLYEGFGLPPAEGMVYGTPALVARAASLPEVVGDSGLLFDPRDDRELLDHLERLWTDPELRRELGEKGRNYVRKFNWADNARAHLEIYRELTCRQRR